MKNKRNIVWSFIFFIVFAGCTYHEQVVKEEPDWSLLELPPPISATQPARVKTETKPVSSCVEDEAGYRIRPLADKGGQTISAGGGRTYHEKGQSAFTRRIEKTGHYQRLFNKLGR
ncbi:MAG: hypothetical protein JRF21_04775 [Deltaproteobacteria bacterium]|nr:hypothetical protein [Deltaproteobacteria bacterium]